MCVYRKNVTNETKINLHKPLEVRCIYIDRQQYIKAENVTNVRGTKQAWQILKGVPLSK